MAGNADVRPVAADLLARGLACDTRVDPGCGHRRRHTAPTRRFGYFAAGLARRRSRRRCGFRDRRQT